MMKRDVRLLLEDIRSVHNVGSIFRTAETLGISKIYCVGTTPTPVDGFGRKRKDLAKVALGAEEMIPWQHVGRGGPLVKSLAKDGFKIIALEQSEKAVDYKKVKAEKRMLVILGGEVSGVSKTLINSAGIIAEIPMRGKKESLNVSVSAGVFLFRLLGQ